MRKLVGRMIGFIIFLFACLIIGVIVVLFSTGVLDLYQMFPNLPEPPEIDTKGLPSISEAVPGVPEVELPDTLKPGDTILLKDKVARRPLVARIPTPQQVVTAPAVVGTNLFLAILMALIFGAVSTIMGNMLRDEEPRIQAWLRALGIAKLVEWSKSVLQWTFGGKIKQGCLTLPLVAGIIALYGIIFALLEPGTSLFSREGVFLAVGMAFSVGIVSFSGDVVRRILARFWRQKSRFALYPANLLVAALTVGFSRLLNISPGIVFGTPGGADVDMPQDDQKHQRREVILSITMLVALAFLASMGWALSGLILSLLDTPVEVRLVDTTAGIVMAVQNANLLLFLVALETLFFEALPLAYGTGATIYNWNKIVWGFLFVPIAFVFNHTLLNPQSGFLVSFLQPNVRLLWFVIFVLAGATAALWFYFNILDDVLREAFGVELP